MTSQQTFYLSRVIGKKFFSINGALLGRLKDLLINLQDARPKIIGVQAKVAGKIRLLDFSEFEIFKGDEYSIRCRELKDIDPASLENAIYLVANVLDRQIVDINGRKLVRVNDIRLVTLPSGTFTIAVDVGIEGILRRLGVSRRIKRFLKRLKIEIPTKFILWDDVEAIDFTNLNLKLSQPYSKLHTLHPSDLADIFEDLDRPTRMTVFAALDEEKAADVMEELEPHAQIHLIESLPKEKVADVLEKMPADEVADILDEIDKEKAEELLNEMEKETSEDVRELLEYKDDTVGSIMTTDFLSFNENMTTDETISVLRKLKPESDVLYSLCIIDDNDRLEGTVSLRDLIVSEPGTLMKEIIDKNLISVHDDDDIDTLAEIIEKYDLLAIPVINNEDKMEGMVVIDDIVTDLLDKRKTK